MKFETDSRRIAWSATSAPNKPIETQRQASSSKGADVTSSLSSRHKGKLQDYGNKFHRAALDGYVDMLCEATKRDTNLVALDHHLQLTPTLVAAQCGQLEALRILVGRGGDPERVTSNGSSALHLAAARNHLNCVSFLVNFGVNMWALDNELHTAKDVAAVEQSKEVLEYLDHVMAKQSAINTKLVQKLKEKAKSAAEKRLKQMRKLQLKAIKQVERDERLLARMSQNRRLLKAAHSMSDIKLVGRGCQDLSSISLAPQCDSPAGFGSTGTTGQGERMSSSQTISNYIQQRLQDDLVARSGRLCAQKTPAPGIVGSTTSSSYPSSSVSSVSGYSSGCSAKSILKLGPTVGASKRPSLLEATGGAKQFQPQRSGPKYSDLVALKQEELRDCSSNLAPPATRRPKDAGSAAGSLFASKLRGFGGGVSRKVHLRRLLFAAGNTEAKQSEFKQCQDQPLVPAAMKRARSEPDFSAALRQDGEASKPADELGKDCDFASEACVSKRPDELEEEVEEAEEADEADEAEQSHRGQQQLCPSNAVHPEREEPPAPPPLPPSPLAGEGAENQQQLLLTQCLSQLKLQQQRHNSGCVGEPTGGTKSHSSHSDELLWHQLSAGEFPLRPSIIKHQQQQRHLKLSAGQQGRPRTTSGQSGDKQLAAVSAADSIGSVGSFVVRNSLEPAGLQTECAAASTPAAQRRCQLRHQHVPSSPSAEQPPRSPAKLSYSPSSSSASTAHSRSSSSSASDPIQCDTASASSTSLAAPSKSAADVQLAEFLTQNNLAELAEVLACECIDFEALLLLNEADLKSLGLLLGPRRKLLNAIERHKAQAQRACVIDTQF